MKRVFALTMCLLMSATTAFAYSFPEPDWGALYKERETMVTQTEFELYTEGGVQNAPNYDALLEPPSGAYLGMTVDTAGSFKPLGAYLTYVTSTDHTDLYYPSNVEVQNANVITTVGWNYNSLDEVNLANVKETLDNLSKYNKLMLIRFANEMNCSPLGDDPERYISVFRQAADLIHSYPNFAVVWSPNDIGALDRNFEYYYPGDEYVDWVGVSCYSLKYFQGNANTAYKDSVYFMSGDYAWATNKLKPVVKFMNDFGIRKPIIITESGVETKNIYGDTTPQWTVPRMRNLLWGVIMKYPQVKAINYFNVHRADEAQWYDITSRPYAAEIFREAKDSGAYLKAPNTYPDFVFTPADYGETLFAENNIVNLYTFAYVANLPEPSVNYYVDGAWYSSSAQLPYKCALDISALSDGVHEIEIRTYDISKKYTFFKQGTAIKFGSIAPMYEDNITITVNGENLSLDQNCVIVKDRTLVPLRAIFEALGANVDWDDATSTVTAVKDGKKISLTIGDKTLIAGGEAKTLDVPPQLIGSRTLVPVRAVSESLGANVNWDETSKTVIIN